MKIAYFDCFMGISGDMTLGALLGVGADPDIFKAQLALLGIGGYCVEISKRTTGGIQATDVNVIIEKHSHEQSHHHRHLSDILEIINNSGLSLRVRQTAAKIFGRLAEAEARVHGSTPQEVHFHEVGAVDAIVDIVGSVILLELLGWPVVIASPMPTFYGVAKAAHGVIPLPAPAVIEILRGAPWQQRDIEGELVTPTGAAIIMEIASEFGHLPAMTIEKTGCGAGKSDFGSANILRVMIGKKEKNGSSASATVAVVETNIDDMNPEFYEGAMEKLFAAGALDVFMTPIIMKKSRPGTTLAAICEPALSEKIADIMLTETSTFGVRISLSQRMVLERSMEEVETEFGRVRIKTGRKDGRLLSASPEYEDCKTAAQKHDVSTRVVYEKAVDAFRGKPV